MGALPSAVGIAAEPAASARSAPIGIDLRDLARFSPGSLPEAQLILDSMHVNPVRWSLPKGKVHGIELTEAPLLSAEHEGIELRLIVLISSPTAGKLFRRYSVTLSGTPQTVAEVRALDELPLSKAKFTVQVGLLERRAVVEDAEHGIRKTYPLTVGCLDTGTTKRSHERYRLTRKDGEDTAFALHDCLHLRDKDLTELHLLLTRGGATSIPVEIAPDLGAAPGSVDHSLPLQDGGYTAETPLVRENTPESERTP